MPPSANTVVAVRYAAAVAREEGDDAADIRRLGHTPERDRRVEDLHLLRVVHRRGVDRRRDRTRPHADDPDVVRAELDPRGAREHAHPALRQAVRRVVRHGPVLVHRRDVDDRAAATLGDHLLRRELRAEERALQVDLQHLLVLRLGRVEDRRARLDARVVHHDVEPTERLHALADQHLQVLDLADVGLDADRLVAQLRDLLLERIGRGRIGDVVDADVRPLLRQGEGDALADTAVATRDDGDLALQCHAELLTPRRTQRPPGRLAEKRSGRTGPVRPLAEGARVRIAHVDSGSEHRAARTIVACRRSLQHHPHRVMPVSPATV